MLGVLAHNSSEGQGAGWEVLGSWSWDPILLIPLALGVLYARGLRNWSFEPRLWKPWQPYLFYTGLAAVVITVASPIDALADDLFFMHMIQHMLLVMVGPPLILLGAPTTPVLRGLPPAIRRNVVKHLAGSLRVRSLYRWLTFPVVGWLLFVFNGWTWHMYTPSYDLALRDGGVHLLQHGTFVATASLFWWSVIDPRPLRSQLAYPLRLIYLGVTMFQNVALGASITFRDEILYPFYAEGPRLWNLAALSDQRTGGLIMWIVGDMMIIAALLITMAIWFRRGEERSRQEEARLDAAAHMGLGR